ncbi:MAG TPA: DUF2911 domain-containing protein [Saprospiraceae bacterium]|nr:DUF2911 domain-containing protein [Saprospiraceae bacterium]
MKSLVAMVFIFGTAHCFAQSIFPVLSPKGRLEQNIGSTIITVDYERPAARGRKVFGELVQYDQLWRTGAGHSTRFSFSKPVQIGNKKIPGGTYSLLTIPGKESWTVILNKDTTLYGLGSYDEKLDIHRFKTEAEHTDRFYESLTIDLDVVPNNAMVYLAWESTRISFMVETETDHAAHEFIQKHLLTSASKDPDEYALAAEYYFYLDKDLNQALLLIDKAIVIKNEAWYYRQKVDILEKQGKYQDAIDCAAHFISLIQRRDDWDLKTRQENENEYKTRIEMLKRRQKQMD